MKVVLGLLIVLITFYPVISLAEKHEMNKTIQIEGTFQKQMTPAEKRKRQRKLLEKRTEAMVQKQIEALRLRQEIELAKKLQGMSKSLEKNLENI